MKLKILHCITSLDPDGAQNMLLKLAQRMSKDKFDYEIVSMISGGGLEGRFRDLGIKVHSLGMTSRVPNPLGIFRLTKILKESNPDFLLGWMYHGNLLLSLAARLTSNKKPLYWNIRRALDSNQIDHTQRKLIIKLNAYFSSGVSRIIYCGKKIAEQHEAVGFDKSKRLILLNGFDTSMFRPVPDAKEKLKAELGVSSSSFIVGTVGRFIPEKDHATLIRAAGRIKRSDIHFVLIGKDLTPENEQLRPLIEEHKLFGRVHLLGPRSDVSGLLPGFDLFCLPSASEGFPNVLGEAMAAGLPCVSTDAGISAEIVGETGKVVPVHNPELLAQAIESLISLPHDNREELGARARERVIELFDIENISKLYEDEYERVTRSSGGINCQTTTGASSVGSFV